MTKGPEKVGPNAVFQDQIWRDYIKREWWSTLEWPKKYGFLSEESKKLQRDILEYRRTGIVKKGDSDAQTISSGPSEPAQSPVPQTTSNMIGWKLSSQENPEYKNGYSSNVKYRGLLDPPSRYGKKGIDKMLGIPAEAMN